MIKKNNQEKSDCCGEDCGEKLGKEIERKIEQKFENLGKCHAHKWHQDCHGPGGGCYFLAMVGAAVYYLQQVSGFWPTVVAILKAIVWPALLLYEVFRRLGM